MMIIESFGRSKEEKIERASNGIEENMEVDKNNE